MTQAFNLSQLANNLNTSGQLDATDGLTGLVANANLASSGTANSSTFLRGDRTWASLPNFGKVLQVQSGYNNTKTFLNVTGYVWNNAVSLTPSATSSKILILANFAFGNSNLNGGIRIYRNGAGFMPNLASEGYSQGATNAFNCADDGFMVGDYQIGNYFVQYLDSPATTSACTYSLYFQTPSGGDVNFNRQRVDNGGSSMSTFTLLEIGA